MDPRRRRRMARDGVEQKTEGNLASYLRYGATWKLLAFAMRSGGVRRPKIAQVTEFGDGEVLEVPGRPLVDPHPGPLERPRRVRVRRPRRAVRGDALCTWNPLTGRPGPQLMPRAFASSESQAADSLARLDGIEAGWCCRAMATWTDGVSALVARAREAGPS